MNWMTIDKRLYLINLIWLNYILDQIICRFLQIFTIDGTFLRDVSLGAGSNTKDIIGTGISCIRPLEENEFSVVAAKSKPNSVMLLL